MKKEILLDILINIHFVIIVKLLVISRVYVWILCMLFVIIAWESNLIKKDIKNTIVFRRKLNKK